ncbi:hypothetical protein RQP46_001990 [Phenoliferia psychrophenolica]
MSASAEPMEQDPQPGGFDSDSDSDDDPIVKRIPIFYTPHFLSSLTLLQYPDRPPRPNTQHPLLPPSLRPGADPAPEPTRSRITARYKPKSQHLQVEVPLEREPERWSEFEAAKFGKGLPDKEREKDNKKGRGRKGKKDDEAEQEERLRQQEEKDAKRLDRMMFSSLTVPDVTNYLVGVVKDDALHLTPVTQTFQLRPNLEYLDQIVTNERRAKRDSQRKDDDDSDGEVSDAELKVEAAKAVQVSVKQSADLSGGGAFGPGGGGGGGGNGRAGASLFDPLRAMEGESWIDLEHYHAETPQSTIAFDHMFAQDTTPLSSKTKPKEYLN